MAYVKKIFPVLFLLLPVMCYAQNRQLDSLKKLLQVSKEDTLRVNILLEMNKSAVNANPEEAIKYSNEALVLSEKIHFAKGKALAYKRNGVGYYMQSKYPETLDNWLKSLAVFDSIGDKVGIANLESNIGAVYFDKAEDAK